MDSSHKHWTDKRAQPSMKGTGSGILEDGEVELSVGRAFIVPAGTMHSLRSEEDLYVSSFLVPTLDELRT